MYEQIKPDSMFGRQMIRNLEERGAPLYGVHCTPSLQAHVDRLLSCGWQRAAAEDMLTLYREMLHLADRTRVEGIELFDEFEEWNLIMAHYCIALGVKDGLGVLDGFSFQLDKTAPVTCAPTWKGSEAGAAFRRPFPNAD